MELRLAVTPGERAGEEGHTARESPDRVCSTAEMNHFLCGKTCLYASCSCVWWVHFAIILPLFKKNHTSTSRTEVGTSVCGWAHATRGNRSCSWDNFGAAPCMICTAVRRVPRPNLPLPWIYKQQSNSSVHDLTRRQLFSYTNLNRNIIHVLPIMWT